MGDSDPLRVLLLVDSLAIGGAERLMVPHASGLRARGIDVRVAYLVSRDGDPWRAPLREAGVPVRHLGLRSLLDPRPMIRLAAHLRQERMHLIHTHLRYSDLIGQTAAVLSRTPAVSTVHTIVEGRPSRGADLRRRLDLLTTRYSGATVIAVSDAVRREYLRLSGLPPARVETLFNGVNLEQFQPDPAARKRLRAELGLAPEALVFATVARLRPVKGLQHFVAAAAAVRDRLPGARFLVVGAGTERASLEAQARALGVQDAIRFVGARTDVPALLAAADVYVQPSLFDSLPSSVLEEMAVGLPIVATRVGGLPELVADRVSGLLVPPANPEALAGAMLALTDADPRERMGAAGRTWAMQHVSLDVWLDGLERIYRRVARPRR